MILRTAVALFLTIAAIEAFAKGATIAIRIQGESLEEPIELNDPQIVRQFRVFAGPNSRWRQSDGPWHVDLKGAFADFERGTVEGPPEDVDLFFVDFVLSASPDLTPSDTPYRVEYGLAPEAENGYIRIPMQNTFIHHDVEGEWLRSSELWDNTISPMLRKAQHGH